MTYEKVPFAEYGHFQLGPGGGTVLHPVLCNTLIDDLKARVRFLLIKSADGIEMRKAENSD